MGESRGLMDTNSIVKITELKNWEQNPRSITEKDFERLKKQIQKLGQYKPLLVNQDNIVLAGNMRLRALQDLGINDVWVNKVTTKDEAEMIEYALSDNDRAGEYDEQQLAELATLHPIDLELYHVDLGKATPLPDLVDKYGPEAEEDEPPEVDESNVVSKLGEVYQLGKHRLMCGDSTDKGQVEQLMNGVKADMVFTDPPYGIDFQSNFREKTPQFDKLENDKIVIDITPMLGEVMRNNTVAYICTRWDLYPKWFEQVSSVLDIKNCIVWYKKGGGLGDLENAYSPNHEFIIVAHKGSGKLRDKRVADVWEIARDGFSTYKHPTQKPVALSAFAIKHHSAKDNLIIDLFLGSGSTLIACEQTGRICYGMEIDPKYVDVVRKRYAKYIDKEEEWQEVTPLADPQN